MSWVFAGQGLVLAGLYYGQLALKVFVFVDSLRFGASHYDAVGKQTRTFWLVVLGLSLALGFVTSPLHLVNLAGTVAGLVYLLGVRPELQRVKGTGRGRSSSDGPYGPW